MYIGFDGLREKLDNGCSFATVSISAESLTLQHHSLEIYCSSTCCLNTTLCPKTESSLRICIVQLVEI